MAGAVLAGVVAVNALKAQATDALVFVGSGRLGDWETRFYLANPTAANLGAVAGVSLLIPGGCPITGCPGYQFVTMFPFGGTSFATPGIGEQLDTIYIQSEDQAELPAVSAATANAANARQAVPVPGYKLSTLQELNASSLVFPNARGGDGRSNLVLTNLLTADDPPRGGVIALNIQAYSTDGEPLGFMTRELGIGETIMLLDVYSQLANASSGPGQLRVTRISGDRVFWGVLYSFSESGATFVSTPLNP